MLSKYLSVVKTASEHFAQRATETSNAEQATSYFKIHTELKALSLDIEETDKLLNQYQSISINADNFSDDYISLPQDRLEGLPAELIQQLSISKTDEQEMKFIQMIKSKGGTMSLDNILIAWYQITNEIFERNKLTAKLYRMGAKGLINAVPGKKGIYTTNPVNKINKSEEHKTKKEENI